MSPRPTWLAIKRQQDKRQQANEQRISDKAAEATERSYRDVQAEAKDLDIPANQSREDLEKAIDKAKP